jgi:ABC-2 type transport system ATP-binding protein
MNGEPAAIRAEGVRKSFGNVQALKGVDVVVPYGTVLGLLGPNGAGKTTLVRVLTTLLAPDAGRAEVAGYDVKRDASALRTVIGLAGQYAAIDENLTGFENLEMVGRLYHLSRRDARQRATELLERFDLAGAAGRLAKTYSGGMRRRLDLAASLVARPKVLFLDEPTTGLDPRSRLGLWDIIGELVNEGTTVLLTTQYLEEADRLSDRITMIDDGRVIAEGTAEELKARSGGAVLQLRVADRRDTAEAADVLASLGAERPKTTPELGEVTMPVADGASLLAEIVRRLDSAGITISDIGLRQPTLDDVFLALTGRTTEVSKDGAPDTAVGRRGRRMNRSAV